MEAMDPFLRKLKIFNVLLKILLILAQFSGKICMKRGIHEL